ncbi:putative tricarboxylic transport membrane protein [Paenisporosarcina quisquiliarum]|jgi:putative tricarboxylic transport membrane protein|uniref:tripartite tricarboxylate transporter TctB family protein n=1 Tax=Psychrobacillus TaxID=1221880 RepID=UPI0008BB00B4|nr:tripartite tricarboxylate transporter TctB family protein [Psychrobacillus psychrodurans]MCK1999126.1 tripartite tricarboxylate transporter TctB family protein [Psychrobacillus psychrodurans]MCZ8541326.1 tripartite tricarboxylate transporter TctB family protein [Psychrobacillus psychrodurans]SEN53941.1 putative tricarboxylic transport membrane protein [Paenisporosarcina quisquiliarum]SFM96325.1 putative tricarboxylic transport membrane protein [Psychrobacillus psychrodurans]
MNKKFDRVAGIAFLLIGILFFIESQKISDSAYGSSVGPKIFPMGLGLILTLLSIRLLYETFKYKTEDSTKDKLQYKKFFIIFGSALLYAFFLEKIGYVVSTFLFLLIAFQTLERGKVIYSIIISTVFSVGIYYMFSELLGGSLPGFPLF